MTTEKEYVFVEEIKDNQLHAESIEVRWNEITTTQGKMKIRAKARAISLLNGSCYLCNKD